MISWQERYTRWHALRVFFEDPATWEGLAAALGMSPPLRAEYEALLYGTDGDVCVPLWASAALDPWGTLLDGTTRDVILFYKKWGYAWTDMDGNPPDYIGQQCRFLEYLSRCLIPLGDGPEAEAYQDFIAAWFGPTCRAMTAAMEGRSWSAGIHSVMEELTAGLSDAPWDRPLPDMTGFDSFAWTRGPAILPEPPRTTTQTSFGDCGKKCRTLAVVQEGCVLSVRPDTEYPAKRFTGCPRGARYRQTFLSARRLRYPMLRTGRRGEGKFRRITWEEAEAFIARAIRDTADLPESRYILPGSGVSAVMRGDRFLRDLLSLTGGYLGFYNFYSCACAETVLPYVYGTDVCGSSEEEMERTKLLILWGHNPVNTLWGDGFLSHLEKAKCRGVRIVVIDPRRSETARRYADRWIPIRPSTDGALADAMAYEIWSRGLQDQAFMDRFCLGFDEEHMPPGTPPGLSYRSYLFGEADGVVKDAAWAEPITGVPAGDIRSLALEYARTKPACLMPGLGPQRTLCGEQNCRSFAMLACLTGNVGVPGGGSGGYPNRPGHPVPGYTPREDPYPGRIPSFRWTLAAADWERMDGAEGLQGVPRLRSGIRLMFSIASGMLMGQHSNINETARILGDTDKIRTLIVSDLFMTPGARYADLLLPGTSFFETENIVPPWNASDYLLYNAPAVRPLFGSRFEYDWVLGAADRLGLEQAVSQGRDAAGWLRCLYDAHRALEPELPDYDAFRAEGCHVYGSSPYHVAFSEQIREGRPFDTPSGKIEIFSPRLYERGDSRLPGVPRYVPCEEGAEDPLRGRFPIQLIGYHTLRRCHSTFDNDRFLDRVDRPAVWLHPRDAAARGIRDGDLAEVFNDRGAVRVPARVTEDVMPGVAAMSEGGWFTPDENGTDVRGSINVLTMTHRATPLAHANPQHTNLVELRRAEGGASDQKGVHIEANKRSFANE